MGDANPPGVVGAKGLERPCEEVPPFLRDRLEKSRGVVLSAEPGVPNERLPVVAPVLLLFACERDGFHKDRCTQERTYLLRRVHIDSCLSMMIGCCSQPVV